jgi:CheY-like chemotaxis protein
MQLRILAVDDEPQVLDLFKDVVGPLGYDIVALSDSREAAQRIMTEKFDMIALDVRMPALDGFELTERIRASNSNRAAPILMFTAYDSIETMRKGFAAGITFYIAKPLTVQKLRGLFSAARGLMIQERRRYVRLPLRAEVICLRSGRHFKARSVNVAQGGILLEGSCGAAEGEIIELEFALPGVRDPLRLMGKVARKATPDGIALEFIEPEPPQRAALHHYVVGRTKE